MKKTASDAAVAESTAGVDIKDVTRSDPPPLPASTGTPLPPSFR